MLKRLALALAVLLTPGLAWAQLSGAPVITGSAGTPNPQVLSVQGVASMTPLKVDGSAVTQPVSASSLPLPTGASTAAKQPALGTAGSASSDVLTVQGIASMTALKVDGSAVTQPVSAASLPLPTGAATAAKQPALGTAGSASSDVISVQGIASMTPLSVTGSGTFTVSGTVTANAGTGNFNVIGTGSAGTPASGVVTVQGITSMTALKVDGSGVTQPVSGTITANQGGSPWGQNLLQLNSVALGSPSTYGTSPGAVSVAGVNAFITNSPAVTGSGNFTVTQATGTNLHTVCDSGCSSSTAPSDNSAFTAGTTPQSPAGFVFNDGITPLTSGNMGAARVTANRALHTVHRDSLGRELGSLLPPVFGYSPPVQVALAPSFARGPSPLATALSTAASGAVKAPGLSPSSFDASQVVVLSPNPSLQCPFVAPVSSTATAVVVPGRPGKRTMVCTMLLVLAGAEGLSLDEGTGTTCGTGTAFLSGAAGGTIQFSANNGFIEPSDRITLPLQTVGDDFCVVKSSTNNVSGHVTYGYFNP